MNQPPYKLDPDSTERIIKDLLIYKDAQLKVILKNILKLQHHKKHQVKKNCKLIDQIKRQQLATEFQKKQLFMNFKQQRHLDSWKHKILIGNKIKNQISQQVITMLSFLVEGIKQTDLEIENLKSVYQIEEQIKINRQHYENLSKQISSYENVSNVVKNIEVATKNIEQLKIQHKQAAELIKIKEKQLFMMVSIVLQILKLHLMQDLIEVKYEQ